MKFPYFGKLGRIFTVFLRILAGDFCSLYPEKSSSLLIAPSNVTTLWSPRMLAYSQSRKDSKEIAIDYVFVSWLQLFRYLTNQVICSRLE